MAFMAASSPETVRDDLTFAGLALELFQLHFHQIPLYRRFCEARGCRPSRASTWRDIPALPTSAFQSFEVSSIPQPDRTTVFVSSGTVSQVRSRHFHHQLSLEIYEASLR